MKKATVLGLLALLCFFASANASAALHTISVMDLPNPSGIEAYNIWFEVSNDFELIIPVADGSAIPVAINLGWSTDTETVSPPLFKLAKSNLDALMSNTSNNMLNGDIASFNYNGSIIGVNFFQFGDFYGNEISLNLLSHDQDRTIISAVPIPSALLLLGSGLVGLTGIRCKRNAKKIFDLVNASIGTE